jgi:hypothetical protein
MRTGSSILSDDRADDRLGRPRHRGRDFVDAQIKVANQRVENSERASREAPRTAPVSQTFTHSKWTLNGSIVTRSSASVPTAASTQSWSPYPTFS